MRELLYREPYFSSDYYIFSRTVMQIQLAVHFELLFQSQSKNLTNPSKE